MGCGISVEQMDASLASPAEDRPAMDWLDPRYHDEQSAKIFKPHELESTLTPPPHHTDDKLLDKILGSMIGLALGDALGAHVEFRPHTYMMQHPVADLEGGGTWGLTKGQFTDDTSMSLCLAISLIVWGGFNPYDQLVRYKWWYRNGYMSSTGHCFDIGAATRSSLNQFEARQRNFAQKYEIPENEIDYLSKPDIMRDFDVNCGKSDAAGNGSLMRLAPVPLFFHRNPKTAVQNSGLSSNLTHGDRRAYDACRFYGALIVAALNGESKKDILSSKFYRNHQNWFNNEALHQDVEKIAKGSYKNKENGHEDGIRGKGFVCSSLEAALWAFWIDEDSFEKGALAAVNLGDDADTTAAIYGQLAGAYYGYSKLPEKWVNKVYASKFITCLSEWLAYEGKIWSTKKMSQTPPSKL